MRYQVKPERAAENQQLIEAVFAQLEERESQGFTAFQAFVAQIADRCDVPPVAVGATIVGGYD